MVTEKVTIITEMVDNVSKNTRKINASMSKMVQKLKTFKFEWLSVMFLGMAINRVFGQYVKNAMEMTGVSELFNEALTLMVFSALEPFLEIMYGLIDIFFNLPEPVQKLIGALIIFGAIFGTILAVVGSLGVFFATTLVPLLTAMGIGFGAVAIGVGIFLAAIAALVLIFYVMYIAWQSNFLGMQGIVAMFVNSFKQAFSGAFEFIKGIFKVFQAIFTGDFELLKEGIKQIFTGLFDFLFGIVKTLASVVVMILVGALNMVWNIVKIIIDGIKWLIDNIGRVTSSVVSTVTGGIAGKRANGGPVSSGSSYLVGERGPELFTPSSSGSISPNGSSGQIVFSPVYNITVSDKYEFERMIKNNNTRQFEDLRRLIQD
jgi:hypothetical protein